MLFRNGAIFIFLISSLAILSAGSLHFDSITIIENNLFGLLYNFSGCTEPNCSQSHQLYQSQIALIRFLAFLLNAGLCWNLFYLIRKNTGMLCAQLTLLILLCSTTYFSALRYATLDVPLSLILFSSMLATTARNPLKGQGTPVIAGAAMLLSLGLLIILGNSSYPGAIFFAGEPVLGNSFILLPTLFLLKEQIPWLILLVGGLLSNALLYQARKFARSRMINWSLELTCSCLVLLYVAALSFSRTSALQQLIPIYPPLAFLSACGILRARVYKHTIYRWSHALIFLSALGLFINFPNYVSYFNALGRGSDGYLWSARINLDQGQDILRLARWVKDKGIKNLFIDLYGDYNREELKDVTYSEWSMNKGIPPAGSILVISAAQLELAQSKRFDAPWGMNYEWISQLDPIHRIGDSLFVYRIPLD